MNKIMIIAVALLLITTYTKAQSAGLNDSTNNRINQTDTQAPFTVTKGYYAIYHNAAKLNHQSPTIVINKNVTANYTKGFYSINGKHTHLHKGGKSIIVTVPKRPIAIKGYYSIRPDKVSDTIANLMVEVVDTMHIAPDKN